MTADDVCRFVDCIAAGVLGFLMLLVGLRAKNA